jgi:hypothetical protein
VPGLGAGAPWWRRRLLLSGGRKWIRFAVHRGGGVYSGGFGPRATRAMALGVAQILACALLNLDKIRSSLAHQQMPT